MAALATADDHTMAPFTPDHAAPEHLSGEAVTTSTDIPALGVILFELLTGERPFRTRGLPSTQALKRILDRKAPAMSRIAATNPSALRFARLLIMHTADAWRVAQPACHHKPCRPGSPSNSCTTIVNCQSI